MINERMRGVQLREGAIKGSAIKGRCNQEKRNHGRINSTMG